MTLTLDFQGQILKKSYLRNGMANWHGIKGMWVDRMLDPCCDFQCPPHPWPWPWIFKVKFGKCCISGMGGTIDMERKGCESIGCYTTLWLSTLTSTMTFILDFQSQILKKSYLRNGMADWLGMKGMWVDRMLDPCCDFQLYPRPWPWPWIFKVKFWKSLILWMGWPIDMEWQGCESIECWTHVVTFNVHLFHDLDLGFSRWNFEKVVSQEWDGRLTWNEGDVSR